MRIYNPSLGRFLSVDPLAKEFAWNSTYAFAENDLIRSSDMDGAERKIEMHWMNSTSLSEKSEIQEINWTDLFPKGNWGHKGAGILHVFQFTNTGQTYVMYENDLVARVKELAGTRVVTGSGGSSSENQKTINPQLINGKFYSVDAQELYDLFGVTAPRENPNGKPSGEPLNRARENYNIPEGKQSGKIDVGGGNEMEKINEGLDVKYQIYTSKKTGDTVDLLGNYGENEGHHYDKSEPAFRPAAQDALDTKKKNTEKKD